MSSLGSTVSEPRDEDDLVARLRHPGERSALAAAISMNVMIVTVAIIAVFAGTHWLAEHPFVERYRNELRAIAVAAILAFPATLAGRHARLHAALGDGIQVSERQLPELYRELLRVCDVLRVDRVPRLLVGKVREGLFTVHSVWPHEHVIVLERGLFDADYKKGFDWISFALAGAVGAIKLGHTRWWVELLTAYTRKIPGLRAPLLVHEVFSSDRCAAYAVPRGVRGLLIEGTGMDGISNFTLGPFIDQEAPRGLWALYATFRKQAPLLVARARELYEAGFLDAERDRRRRFVESGEKETSP